MDKVRLGRVLGKAARLAARTAYEAVDAATAPDPRAEPPTRPRAEPRASGMQEPAPSDVPGRRPSTRAEERRPKPGLPEVRPGLPEILPRLWRMPVGAATQEFGKRTLHPLKQASRALWLEVTGSFFALFAFSFLLATWRVRGYLWSGSAGDHWRFAGFCAPAVLFAWFSASSFMRARRRT